jgi:hypothetical protein
MAELREMLPLVEREGPAAELLRGRQFPVARVERVARAEMAWQVVWPV